VKIPSEITAGDSVSWDDDPSTDNLGNPVDPANGWTLKYDFRKGSVANLTVTAVTQGTGWRTSLTAAQTATYGPVGGVVYFQAYAVKGIERVTLGSGSISLKPNIAAAANTDELRSQDEQDLSAVQAAMRAMVSGGAVAEYTIGGRSLRKIPMADLIALESRLKARVASARKAERIKNGLGNPSNVFVRFNK
jgi:hypothetical protein